ncbi:MAG TPA: 5'-nucleotidase, lipoprotein e(P4) family [Saprospiraceae bacterium]|nr:5'-nucleotidase, lipoprotein e(P4) family [Saprospiraceae bacterium]
MKKISLFVYPMMLLLFLTSCKTSSTVYHHGSRPAGAEAQVSPVSDRKIHDIALNGKVYSAVWQQNAGEFRALCYQAYNIARLVIDQEKSKPHSKPLAIVTDVDETFLDNSPYAVRQAELGNEFDVKSWTEWTAKGDAVAYPGSIAFFNHASIRDVTVFYITNRAEAEREGTLKNLKQLGFPFADDTHLMLMKETSDKEARRQEVLKNYEVIMYLGDNLNDFSKVFYKLSQEDRNKKADELSSEFGSRFIVLPNSGYGNWESAIPGYKSNMTPEEKDAVFMKSLKTY